ncbi:GGDEF domain-containing protein [Hyphomicrobium sp.]|uniref:GGDEF domain-containing protein n=1 Tax=Hyphomicrobium sp. TaxID=82 RepID=UPI002C29C387|nr:GGDEF domain-containing protein [Hyphomicrobium sp.]HRN87525.1 GGDEF domain-containing protein [Hyphomicrobium sp.]HRQ27034.1 GGDEF domain-containing protein [Hyphomicrobium sp.]
MASLPYWFSSRRGLILAGGALGVVTLLGSLAFLGVYDPAPFLTLRTVTERGAVVIETRYNPVAFIVLGVLAAITFVCAVLLARFIRRFVPSGPRATADELASASATLGRELANALAVIRLDLANKETYARSLANAQGRLAGLTEADQVRVVVSLLVAENERMRLASEQDKHKLENSAREIDALQTSLRGAEEATLTDPLTGIGNRRLFNDAMKKAIQDSHAQRVPLSLIMCDIDHFKRVNDMFGHDVGDEIIRALARVIETSVRETDSVARYGGEEFAIILPGTELNRAKETADRIRRQFGAKQFAIRKTNQKIGQVTASFGVAEHRPGDDVQEFVRRADAKLYEAKARGRDRVADFSERR